MVSTFAGKLPRDAARRVVLTGFGVVSSIGTGVEEFTAGLRAGRSGAKPITAFETEGFEHSIGCGVTDFAPEQWIKDLPLDSLGPATRFAVSAARMAVEDAGLDPAVLRRQRGMVSIGTTDGESHDLDQLVATELADGPEAMDPRVAARIPAGRLSAAIAQELGLTDVEAVTIPTACAAGNYAIGYGYDAVRSGDVDFALCGGADAMCRKTFAGFYRLGTIAPDCCRPFDVDRKGILTGEGAGVLVLESLQSALRRGARIYAEVLGYGLNCDAYHQVAPDQDGVARAMSLALQDAGVEPGEVDLISAHGTGTKANDVTETRAIRDVFGAEPPRTVSIKSMLGHSMGAASALAAIACSLAIVHRFIPPTINHTRTDPDCAVDCVPNEAVEADLRVVQNNGLAFGGNNAVVVLGRYDGNAQAEDATAAGVMA
ncbi:3-oxoacyl-ACP synthase [Streptomyces hygroscopicus]|uniref:beta-ketoacyl-[acyl-carrier-protein] synthase family protein n=1 Tax=Streptomyces hygroscopicus TaxID=1912 RepID=UPI00223EB91F|nr:beta-ketoacyl-[acyl-carrier-protein] synthase family protein [Streptomyces hygroscopicus]MCW7944037.1 3-oxoacyl-ACP synthase [Streptomyces hygroscopicus]